MNTIPPNNISEEQSKGTKFIAETSIPGGKNSLSIQGLVDEVNQHEKPFLKKFRDSILDQQKDYPAPIPILTISQFKETIAFLTLQSFSLWQGKQKSKKTTFLAMVIAAFISGTTGNDSIKIQSDSDGVVLVFDTEQGESYAARTLKLILKMAGLDTSNRIIYCNLRESSPKDRMNIIRAGIENTQNVKFVVIDGLVDLLEDFMDAAEGHAVITELLSMCSAYNIHIAGVLHQNKADKNARAHIGTISSQKCEIEISAEVDPKDKSQSVVSCVNARGIPFEPFAIKWEKGLLPCIVSEWDDKKAGDDRARRSYEQSTEIAEAVFKPFIALSHTDAIKGIMQASLKSESTAKRMLTDFMGWELIEKGNDGNYRIKNCKGSRVHEGSNGGS